MGHAELRDRNRQIIGSHNFLTSDTKDQSKKREVGLKATASRIIAELIKRFDSAPNLEKL